MFRNATMRLIVAHLVLVMLSTALVLGSVYWRIGGVIDTEQQAVVEAEIRGLADDFARGGTPALAAGIGQRTANPTDRDAVYLLVDADGRRITGNLRGWPPTVAPGGGWTTLDLYRTDRSRPTEISALAIRLPNGERLLVGRDVDARAAFDRTLWRALLWALAATTALALATGWLLSRLVRGRIAEIDGAARAIMAGALDRRVALRGTGDEFDRLAGTLNAMLDRIEVLVRDLRTVTDSLAHDLRSPLGRLVRHLEAAADEEAPEEERRTRIDQALREAEGVLSTATSLLDISRIDAGIGAEQFTAVDLGRLAADVSDLYEAAAEEKRVTLACNAASGLIVRGHDQLLALALSNLVDNALKYAPAGSAITVAAELDDGRPALIVRDRGPGVPEADRARALGRFVRLDPSRGGPGAGLGLALVAAVARMHGGEVILDENAPGLRATLRFPASSAPSAESTSD
jgi:signal transduction histidine kinase